VLVTLSAWASQSAVLKQHLNGELFMPDASEVAKALTVAWIRITVPGKSAKEVVEFYRGVYNELIDRPEKRPRSAGESWRFDRFDAASLLLLIVAAAFILFPVLLR
jgi:hypothetical protein